MRKEELSNEKLKKIEAFISESIASEIHPATVGHKLRDIYNIRIPKLCTVIPELKQSVVVKKLNNTINLLEDHCKKNHKDIASKRVLIKKKSKLYNLKNYYKK